MRSTNTQILENLHLYRQIASKVTPQKDQKVSNILQAALNKLVMPVEQVRRENLTEVENAINRCAELSKLKNEVAQKISSKEKQLEAIQEKVQRKRAAFQTADASIDEKLELNFEDQITALRIRDTKNTLGQDHLGTKTIEILLEEENVLKQQRNESKENQLAFEEENPFIAEMEPIKKEKGKLEHERNSYSHEIKRITEELQKKFDFKYDLVRLRSHLLHYENPDKVEEDLRSENLLEHLSPNETATVKEYLDAAIEVSASALYAGVDTKDSKFSHLYRVLFTALGHCYWPYSYVEQGRTAKKGFAKDLASDFGPSIVATNLLENIIWHNTNSDESPNYTFCEKTTERFKIVWHKSERRILPINADTRREACCYDCPNFVVVKEKILDTVEQLITQNPEISLPDLAIALCKAAPDDNQAERLASLYELKRLHEETPEQVLVTEQRYFMEQQLEQMKENARLEREEIAYQAELDREQAAYEAEQERREIARQAKLDREQAEMAAIRAERQQAEYERSRQAAEKESAVQAKREAEKAERDRRNAGFRKCLNCANNSKCNARIKESGAGLTCGAYRPR